MEVVVEDPGEEGLDLSGLDLSGEEGSTAGGGDLNRAALRIAH